MIGRRILLVEDEHIVATALSRALSAWGAEVVAMAASVEQALALLDTTPGIDAALLDINLRGQLAYSVADELIVRGLPETYRHVPVLQKPFDPDQIFTALFPRETDANDDSHHRRPAARESRNTLNA
jgi:DNA-binding NarL/FixJ family response regulator